MADDACCLRSATGVASGRAFSINRNEVGRSPKRLDCLTRTGLFDSVAREQPFVAQGNYGWVMDVGSFARVAEQKTVVTRGWHTTSHAHRALDCRLGAAAACSIAPRTTAFFPPTRAMG